MYMSTNYHINNLKEKIINSDETFFYFKECFFQLSHELASIKFSDIEGPFRNIEKAGSTFTTKSTYLSELYLTRDAAYLGLEMYLKEKEYV